MYLGRIEVSHLRNLSSINLLPSPGLNIIEGENASGKTSLLEAIHFLALARSFRTNKPEKLIQRGKDSFILFAETGDTTHHRIGIQRFVDNRQELRLDGHKIHSSSQLAAIFPLQIITPESIVLLTGGPSERRSFIDWMMFHVEPNFLQVWKLYHKHLKHRNALLRQNSTETLVFWSQGLIKQGLEIDYLRRQLLERLIPYIRRYCELIMPDLDIQLSYRQGWHNELTLSEALERSFESDLKMRFTTSGPHRADLVFKTGGIKVTELLSRGQLKLLLCVLRLAQMALLHDETGIAPVVLIDDLPAELDTYHRNLLLSLLDELDTQVFVTTTSRELLDFSSWDNVRLFHVKHGNVKEVV